MLIINIMSLDIKKTKSHIDELKEAPKYTIGFLGSGEKVLDLIEGSHLHENVKNIISDLLKKIYSNGRDYIIEEIKHDKLIGESVCIPTNDTDEIVFAQRQNRRGLTRFVKNRKAIPTDTITVILSRKEKDFILQTSFIGHCAPREPYSCLDPKEKEESVSFWSSHALIYGSEPIIPGTETKEKPE